MNSELKNFVMEGESLRIYKYPSPTLKKIAEDVTEFDDEIKTLCQNMLYTMYQAPGIGLAAPQVGVSKRIFVIDPDFDREIVTKADSTEETIYTNLNPQIFINPIIKNKNGNIIHEEGCLSLPGLYENVQRAESITVEYQDIEGNKKELQADEIMSICIQHENDHLDGIVFIDRLSIIKKNLLKKKFKKMQNS